MFQALKDLVLPDGERPCTVAFGLFKGLRVNLNLRHQLQVFLGLWERETFSAVNRLLIGRKVAIDVGACAGEFTLLFLKRPEIEQVIAVEPHPPNLPRLDRNLSLNGLKGDARLSIKTLPLGSGSKHETLTLDSIAPESHKPTLIKIDVDGAELDILEGARELLARNNVALIVETHSESLERDCMRLLEDAGFQCQVIPNARWRRFLPEDRPMGQNRWLVAMKI